MYRDRMAHLDFMAVSNRGNAKPFRNEGKVSLEFRLFMPVSRPHNPVQIPGRIFAAPPSPDYVVFIHNNLGNTVIALLKRLLGVFGIFIFFLLFIFFVHFFFCLECSNSVTVTSLLRQRLSGKNKVAVRVALGYSSSTSN